MSEILIEGELGKGTFRNVQLDARKLPTNLKNELRAYFINAAITDIEDFKDVKTLEVQVLFEGFIEVLGDEE